MVITTMATPGRKNATLGRNDGGYVTSIRSLVQLQGVDTVLAARRETLADVIRQLDDTAALEELRVQCAEAQAAVTVLQPDLRNAELELESTRGHLADVEGKLYGGSVKNPKELVSLQQDATSIQARAKDQEDAALAVMTRVEQLQQASADLTQQLATAEEERRALETDLKQQQVQLEAEIAKLEEQRQGIAQYVPSRDMQVYSTLLTTRQGKAVARLERSLCHGCRITLPMSIQQRVRADQALVQCPSCNRILYVE